MHALSHASAATGRRRRPSPGHMGSRAAFPPEEYHSPAHESQDRVDDQLALPLDDQQMLDRMSDD
eukprot:6731203-Pyramimonas_sp.AAC.1